MDAIDLQRPELLPDALRVRLNSIETLCRDEKYSDELVQHPLVRDVVIEIDNYCMQRRILGIHYTRAFRADIEQRGLLVRTGAETRDEFVQRVGHIFEMDELKYFHSLWSTHQVTQSAIRDSRLWFNFTMGNKGVGVEIKGDGGI